MKKRILLAVLILVSCLCIISVVHADTITSGDFTYNTDDKNLTAYITAWSGSAGSETLTIPSSVSVYRVVSVYSSASFQGAGLKTIILPDSLSSFSGRIDSTTKLQCTADSAVASTVSRFVSPSQPNYELYVRNKAITVLKYNGSATQVTIPSKVDGIPVTALGQSVFNGNSDLTAVTVPSGVTSLGNSVFQNCGNLTSISLPSTLVTIGEKVFYGCGNLTSLDLPDSVTKIGYQSFQNTGIKRLVLPESLSSLGASVFSSTITLQCKANSKAATLIGNFVSATEPDYVLKRSNNALTIQKYNGSASQVNIPSSVDGIPVTALGSSVFNGNSNLTSVTVPSGVTTLGNSAFKDCGNLTSVSLPSSLVTIGEQVFMGCGNLTSLDLPDSVTKIGYQSFQKTGITKLVLPEGLASLGVSVFADTITLQCSANSKAATLIGNFISATEPDYVLNRSNDTLTIQKYNGSAAAVDIPSSVDGVPVTALGKSAFNGNSSLTTVTVPSGVTSLGNYAFQNCGNLASVSLPDSLVTIGEQVFMGCGNLTSLDLPNSVTKIGYQSFQKTGITRLVLPEGLASLGLSVFPSTITLQCSADSTAATLIGDFVTATEPDYVLDRTNDELTIKKYNGSAAEVNIPSKVDGIPVTALGKSAFNGNSSLTTVTVPSGVTSLGNCAFYNCGNLASVSLPSSLVTIGEQVFMGCGNLTSLDLPNSVTKIGYQSFQKTGITRLVLPEGLASLGLSVFPSTITLECYADSTAATLIGNFVSATEPNYVLSRSNDTLTIQKYNGSAAEVNIPSSVDGVSVAGIGNNAFSGNTSITSAVIPDGVTKIGSNAFGSCGNLANVNIPSSVTSIGDKAFTSCAMLGEVKIPDNVSSIGSNAFPKKNETLICNCGTSAYTWIKKNSYPDAEFNPQATYKYSANHLERVTDEAVEPTAEETGLTEGYHCEFCGDVILAQKTLPKITLQSVSFSKDKAVVKDPVEITAVTSTSVKKLNMYAGSKVAKSWTKGYTDKNETRTWKVTYAFGSAGDKTMTFTGAGASGTESAKKKINISVTPLPELTSVSFDKAKATVNQDAAITAVTNTAASKLTMYSGSKAVTSWTDGYTDEEDVRTWKVTFAFSGKGDRTMSFKVSDDLGNESEVKKAKINITKAPTLESVKFSKAKATAKQNVTIIAVTSTNTTKLAMYSDGKQVKAWTSGYTDADGKRTWKVTYAFAGAGVRTVSFKAIDANGAATSAKSASITITKAATVTLDSVKFAKAKATVKQKVTISAVTSTSATKLIMYSGSKEVQSWTKGYTDKDGKRTWKVTYAFASAGERTLKFKAADKNGKLTAAKSAKITITEAPKLGKVAFSKITAKVKEKITITAVTTTNVTNLTMYSGGKAVKTWDTGYTDKDGKRTWKVKFAFSGAGNRTVDFKGFDANGAGTAAKTVSIKITK